MEPNVTIDFLGNGQSQGMVANQLISQGRMDPGMLRPYLDSKGRACVTVYKGGDAKKAESYETRFLNTNAAGTLRRDEWKQLDQAVLKISEQRLSGVQDLIDNGLTYDLGNGMGTTVLEYHDMSDAMEADLTMDAITRSKNDRPVYKTNYLPIPIIHVDYEINARVLAASRSMGNPLDTTSAERAARKVAEKLEAMLFTNTTYAFGGGTIYSYTNYTNRNTVSIGTHWDDMAESTTNSIGQKILADVLKMKQASIADYHYGPWMLYIPTAYETVLDKDFDADGGNGITIRERILKIAGIKGIKVIDTLTADNVLLVQMTPDVVRLVRGMGIQNVQWEEEGKMVTKYKVMTIQVPQIRADQNGRCGIVHLA
jgi:uncharacterized linocin/CFP29 family protein